MYTYVCMMFYDISKAWIWIIFYKINKDLYLRNWRNENILGNVSKQFKRDTK